MEYAILQKLQGERAKLCADSLGIFKEDVEGTWEFIGTCETLPGWKGMMVEQEVKLLSTVHGRVFHEPAVVHLDGETAYLKYEVWLDKIT